MASKKKETPEVGVSAREQDEEAASSGRGFLFVLLRVIGGIALAASGAALLALAFPPYGFWPLIFCGFVPILVAAHRVIPFRLAGIALGLGVGGFMWGYFYPMHLETGDPYLYFFPYAMGVIVFLIGTYQRAFHNRTNYRFFVLEGAIMWVGLEMARLLFSSLGTAGFLANSLYEQFWLIQPTSLVGVFGVSLLIILVNYVLAQRVISLLDDLGTSLHDGGVVNVFMARFWLYGLVVLLIFWIGYSLVLLESPTPALRAASIQPGKFVYEVEVEGETIEVTRDRVEFQEDLDTLKELTREAADENAKLIVWNEGALPFNPRHEGTDIFKDFAKEIGSHLIVTYQLPDEEAEATILSPDGVFLGTSHQTLIGHLGTANSAQIDFTEPLREITREGSRIVTVSSRDAPSIARMRLSHNVYRALENSLSLVVADDQHVSAIIDPHGRIERKSLSSHPAREILIADIPPGSGDSLVVEWGDWVGMICLLGAAVFLVFDVIFGTKEKKRLALERWERKIEKKKREKDEQHPRAPDNDKPYVKATPSRPSRPSKK